MAQWKPSHPAILVPGDPLTRGLVGAWMFTEGAGLNAQDASGRGNHGTLTATPPTWVGGREGYALRPSGGTGRYVDCGTGASLNTGLVSVELFLAWDGTAQTSYAIDRKNANAATVSVYRSNTSSDWQFQIRLDGSESTARRIDSDTNAVTDEWAHLVCIYDGSTQHMYRDGVLQTDTNSVAGALDADSFTSFFIGSHSGGTLRHYGDIGYCRYWNRALTAGEARTLYRDRYAMLRVADLAWLFSGAVLPLPLDTLDILTAADTLDVTTAADALDVLTAADTLNVE
jgi:hypothetical protein